MKTHQKELLNVTKSIFEKELKEEEEESIFNMVVYFGTLASTHLHIFCYF